MADNQPRSATLADHANDSYGSCVVCRTWRPHTDDEYDLVPWPCPTVRLSAQAEPSARLSEAVAAAASDDAKRRAWRPSMGPMPAEWANAPERLRDAIAAWEAQPEPSAPDGLDVERLTFALTEAFPYLDGRDAALMSSKPAYRARAERVAAEYDRLTREATR